MTRKICYITGTRADFGLMKSTLELIKSEDLLELTIIATGMHLSVDHGMTIDEIRSSGFFVDSTVELNLTPYTGSTMAINIGEMLIRFVTLFEKIKPDIVLLLGDRGEMLAAAIAAIHLNIHVAHIHGGERSGTIDEPIRHSISKLSHFHMVATKISKKRLVKMGEKKDRIWVTGAPGLDSIQNYKCIEREKLIENIHFDSSNPIALFIYHPILQEVEESGSSVSFILDYLLDHNIQVVALMPNSDSGSQAIVDVLENRAGLPGINVLKHLERDVFLSWMNAADFMIGNSSSGIIEAANFGIPVINIGLRQNLRERNQNVVDVSDLENELDISIQNALQNGKFPCNNIYGKGDSGRKICQLLTEVPLTPEVLLKTNEY